MGAVPTEVAYANGGDTVEAVPPESDPDVAIADDLNVLDALATLALGKGHRHAPSVRLVGKGAIGPGSIKESDPWPRQRFRRGLRGSSRAHPEHGRGLSPATLPPTRARQRSSSIDTSRTRCRQFAMLQ